MTARILLIPGESAVMDRAYKTYRREMTTFNPGAQFLYSSV
jgi:hypothetical protein